MQERFGDSSGSPSTPPTSLSQAGETAASSKWPTVVGIIGIVLGAWGLLTGVFGAVSVLFLDSYMGLIGQATPEPQMMQAMTDIMRQFSGWQVALTLCTAVLGALLLVGSILIVRRRQSSVGIVRVWALLRMLVVVGNVWISIQIQHAVLQAAPQQLPGMFGNALAVMSGVMGLVFGWAFPVFLLVWFARKKIRQDVALWT